MSTSIEVYPQTTVLPRVEDTRRRAEQLLQALCARHGLISIVTIEAFMLSSESSQVDESVDPSMAWHPGLGVRFEYRLDGAGVAYSWPMCFEVDDSDYILHEGNATEAGDRFRGRRAIVADLETILDEDTLGRIALVRHYWQDCRTLGAHPLATAGYGLVAAALAEATDGVIASFDFAFPETNNGETATEFLHWWGADTIANFSRKVVAEGQQGE